MHPAILKSYRKDRIMAEFTINPVSAVTSPPRVVTASNDNPFFEARIAELRALQAQQSRDETAQARTERALTTDTYYDEQLREAAYLEGVLEAQALVGSSAAFLVVNDDGTLDYERLALILQQQLSLQGLALFNESDSNNLFGADDTGLLQASGFYNYFLSDGTGYYAADGSFIPTAGNTNAALNVVA